MSDIKLALKQVRRYTHPAVAHDASLNQRYCVPVLIGCDGKYWVATSNRDAGLLMRAGYQVVPRS